MLRICYVYPTYMLRDYYIIYIVIVEHIWDRNFVCLHQFYEILSDYLHICKKSSTFVRNYTKNR